MLYTFLEIELRILRIHLLDDFVVKSSIHDMAH